MKKILILYLLLCINSNAQVELNELLKPNLKKYNYFYYNPDDIMGIGHNYYYSQYNNTRYITRIAIYKNTLSQDINFYTDSLILDWNLNTETNGRFIFYTFIKDSKKVVVRFGSRLKPFFPKGIQKELNKTFKNQLKNNMMETYNGHLFEKKKNPAYLQIFNNIDSIIAENIALGKGFFNEKMALNYPSVIIKPNNNSRIDYTKEELTTGDSLEIDFFFNLKLNKGEVDKEMLELINELVADKNESIEIEFYDQIPFWDSLILDIKKKEIGLIKVSSPYSAKTSGDKIYFIEDVVNQRGINNVWVSNQDYILTTSEVAKIDKKLKEIEAKTSYEVAVVVLNDLNGDAFNFGLDLFNNWGIGKKGVNNGLLIMVIKERRKTVMNVGTGTELILSDALTFLIQENEMNPYFKDGQFATGILNGLDEIQLIFENNPSFEYKETPLSSVYRFLKKIWIIGIYVLLTIFATIYFLFVLIRIMFIRCPTDKYNKLNKFNMRLFRFFPFPFLIIKQLNKVLLNKWRNTSRFSTKDGQIMFKLNDQIEKSHMTDGQKLEEELKSVDYDVWATKDLSHIMMINYDNKDSEYLVCSYCNYKTRYEVYDKVIRSPTYSSSGKSKVKQNCKHCKKVRFYEYTISKLTYSSSSSDSDWSSDSGSDWGGGDSSGGGSSSDW